MRKTHGTPPLGVLVERTPLGVERTRPPTPPFGGFYENSVPIFQRKTVTVENMDMLPIGCLNAKVLRALASKMDQLEMFHRKHGGKKHDAPCLRLVQGSREGRITALVQSGGMMLKLSLRGSESEWIVLGDALKVSD